MLGLKRGTVQLLPYQESWAEEGARAAARLQELFGSEAADVRHVGSCLLYTSSAPACSNSTPWSPPAGRRRPFSSRPVFATGRRRGITAPCNPGLAISSPWRAGGRRSCWPAFRRSAATTCAGQSRRGWRAGRAGRRSWTPSTPVSYTHLDVYKRQVQFGEQEVADQPSQ